MFDETSVVARVDFISQGDRTLVQVGMTVNRGHDESKGDNQVAAEANGVLQSCSKLCVRLRISESVLGLWPQLPDKECGET